MLHLLSKAVPQLGSLEIHQAKQSARKNCRVAIPESGFCMYSDKNGKVHVVDKYYKSGTYHVNTRHVKYVRGLYFLGQITFEQLSMIKVEIRQRAAREEERDDLEQITHLATKLGYKLTKIRKPPRKRMKKRLKRK